jgi:hypothetical protein
VRHQQPQAADSYTPMVAEFDRLMAEGLSVDVEAYWGAGLPTGRYRADKPDWSYEATARGILAEAGGPFDVCDVKRTLFGPRMGPS